MDRAASAAHGPAMLDGSLDGVRYRKRAQENRDDRRIRFRVSLCWRGSNVRTMISLLA